MTPRYTRDNLPDQGWHEFAKTGTTRMIRIDGRFEVLTREGPITCEDGWLAVDSNGDPYPIARDVQTHVYRPA